MEKLIFSKKLKPTHVNHGIDVPRAALSEFGIMPESENQVVLLVEVKDEAGMTSNFRLATRTQGHPKPVIASTDWFNFVNKNNLREGDVISFYKITNQANGELIGYKVKLQVPGAIKIFGAIVGRQ